MSLATPRFRVTIPGSEPFIIRVTNPDLVRWDRIRAQRRWPGADVAPMLWATFVAWSAAKRAGSTTLEYPEFEDTAEEIEMVDAQGNAIEDPAQAGTADPTPPGVDPG